MKYMLNISSKIWTLSLIAVMMSCASFVSVAEVSAAGGEGGININPLIMELELEAGKEYKHEIKVSNTSRVEDFIISGETFDISIEPETHNVKFFDKSSKKNELKSLASWIVPENDTKVLVEAGSSYDFAFTIEVPSEAEPGDYYASINFYFEEEGKLNKPGNVQVRQSIGSLLLVSIRGAEESVLHGAAEYEVSELEAIANGAETNLAVNFFNNGLRYIHLKSQIKIVDAAGEVYYQKEGGSKRVFPGDKSKIESSFPNTYLAQASDLTLNYTLVDLDERNKYYEKAVALSTFTGQLVAEGLSLLKTVKWLFIFFTGGLLVALLVVWRQKRRPVSVVDPLAPLKPACRTGRGGR